MANAAESEEIARPVATCSSATRTATTCPAAKRVRNL